MLDHQLKDWIGPQGKRFGIDSLVQLKHSPEEMLLVLVCTVTIPKTGLQMVYPHPRMCKQIQKEAALPEMEALQKELSSQAAGQAPLENPVKDGQAD